MTIRKTGVKKPVKKKAGQAAATKKRKATKTSEKEARGKANVKSATAKPDPALPDAVAAASEGFPVVGIGASAGGLAAFEAFFSGMPADVDPGMAFVLVQHLAPDHKSVLSDLVQRYTRMQVFEVQDGMAVQPNCAYIIPPGRDMAFLNGALQLLEPSEPRGQRLPIDFFFRSLAQDQHERAIGIVLSGTGSDGTLGVRAIKGEGGMVMAQSPGSTEFDGMPRSAIATGLVDYQLPPAEMPAQLMSYVAHVFGKLHRRNDGLQPSSENALKRVHVLLRARTGHDFSLYKQSTIMRRIERRMAVHQIDGIERYAKLLQEQPAEIDALFRDLLIGVTSFFRDPDAFHALETEVIPSIFASKPVGAQIRVWSAGCSTGEEAYSIAILLQERMEGLKQHYPVQIFATDIDSTAIAAARQGLYPPSIAADVTPERLARFFTLDRDGGGYRINKGIRDMLIFSIQDVIKDPPFSKLDLVSCRNLMIYLSAELQKRLVPMLHYALNPGGVLFLGSSEGIGEYAELFSTIDRKAKIYQRKEIIQGAQRPAIGRFSPTLPPGEAQASRPGMKSEIEAKRSLRTITEQALLQFSGLTAALVNAHGDILYLHGRSGMFLEPAPGESGINNILKMAREGLRAGLGRALSAATSQNAATNSGNLLVKTNGHFSRVDLSVTPIPNMSAESALYLVILQQVQATEPVTPTAIAAQTSAKSDGIAIEPIAAERIRALTQELHAKDEYLRANYEELQTSTEELKSANEEMQSINEELQSTNEELETSKEELQSVNEELATVNTELHTKVADLSRANNDMNNLLAGTGIGTVFVDHRLNILRFTPAASEIINLIPGDVGRPVAHIVHNLQDYDQLVPDVRSVLTTLIPKDVEVRSKTGHWYRMRISPYRTLDNVVEGAVITFIDISEIRQTREALANAEQLRRLALIAHDSRDAIILQDLAGQVLAWNAAATRLYGWSENEALKMNTRDILPAPERAEFLIRALERSQEGALESVKTRRLTKSGSVLEVDLVSVALTNEAGQIHAIATIERAHGQSQIAPMES